MQANFESIFSGKHIFNTYFGTMTTQIKGFDIQSVSAMFAKTNTISRDRIFSKFNCVAAKIYKEKSQLYCIKYDKRSHQSRTSYAIYVKRPILETMVSSGNPGQPL